MENLKKLREGRGLSQQKLAEHFGLSQQSIHKYENGLSQPDIGMLKAFADYFYTTVDYLIGYSEEEYTHVIEPLTSKEVRLVKMYRRLTIPLKEHFSLLLEEVASNVHKNKG